MLDLLENALPLTAGGGVEPTTELEVGGCYAPSIPQVSVSPGPTPGPKSKRPNLADGFDPLFRRKGWDIPASTDPTQEAGTSTSAETGSTGDTDAPVTKPSEIPPASEEVPPLRASRKATAIEIFTWTKQSVLAQTHLSEIDAERISSWVISTWFQDALTIRPCLVITGPVHDAMVLLRILNRLCRMPVLVAEFRKGDLSAVDRGCHTALISEPNLNNRSAALLGNLTNPGFRVVAAGRTVDYSMSRAIYADENPTTHKIQNSICIHITATNAAQPSRPEWLQQMTERLPAHLEQYRERNLDHVRRWTIILTSVSSATAAIAAALGRCIVGAPELREKVVALLKPQDQLRLFEMSDTPEAVVVAATLALSRDGREHAYVREIAIEVNRRLEDRGETVRLSPEKVGHRLKKLGLQTRPLSQSGNGLTFDKPTVALIQQLTAIYVVEDAPSGTDNLNGSQTPEKT